MWFNVVKLTLANFIIPLQWYVPVSCTVTLYAFLVRFACLFIARRSVNMLITCFLTASLCCANAIGLESDSMILVFERKYKHAVRNKNSHKQCR